jgi:hypothetical protein
MRKLTAVALALIAVLAGLIALDRVPGAWRLRALLGRTGAEEYARRRAQRLAEFAREAPQVAPGAVAFLGSSTIERFPLAAAFPAARTLDRGIGDEPLADLAARLEASLPPAELAGIVVYAASVDFRADPSGPDQLAAQVGDLLDRLQGLRPGTPLCVLGLLPERAMAPHQGDLLQRLNRGIERACAARGASFVATDRPPLRDESGLAEAFSSDRLHLDHDGYAVLARWILEDGGACGRALSGER